MLNVLFWILVVVWGGQTLALLLFFAFSLYTDAKRRRDEDEVGFGNAKTVIVVEVLSGDTLTVDVDGERQIIRMSGIACPQGPHGFADEATQLTKTLCLNKVVRYVEVGQSEEQRIAYIHTHEGSCVQHSLLRRGLARHTLDYCDAAFQSIEEDARARRIGLWSKPDPEDQGNRTLIGFRNNDCVIVV